MAPPKRRLNPNGTPLGNVGRPPKRINDNNMPTTPTTSGPDIPTLLADIRANIPAPGTESSNLMHLFLAVAELQQKTIQQQQVLIDRLTAVSANDFGGKQQQNEAEEKERLRSIVVSGIVENEAKPSERRQADRQVVDDILDAVNVDADAVAVYRMGEKKPNKPRLLKVVFGNSGQQRSVLKAAKQLKQNSAFSGVFIRPSLTKEQRKEDYEIRQKVKKMREDNPGKMVRIFGWPGQVRKILIDNNVVFQSGNLTPQPN